MPRRLLGVLIILLVPVIGRAQGESILSYEENFRLKIEIARNLGLDTLPDFKTQLEHYTKKLIDKDVKKDVAIGGDGEWVEVLSLTRLLGQHASKVEIEREKSLMDSIYVMLNNGVDWETLTQKYATTDNCGKPQWIQRIFLLSEWRNALDKLKEGEISAPFYSPQGIHVVKWTGKKYFEKEETPKFSELSKDSIRNVLLVAVLDKKYRKPVRLADADLELFFNKNRKKYKWELPHYRGVVIHCRNERDAKRIKKFLKKYSFLEWKSKSMEIVKQHPESFRIECGIFQIGTNPYVDRLAFKCGSYEPIENLPYTFVMGKKIKKGPENYIDVMDELVGDYLAEHENDWLYELKTVNFGGSY